MHKNAALTIYIGLNVPLIYDQHVFISDFKITYILFYLSLWRQKLATWFRASFCLSVGQVFAFTLNPEFRSISPTTGSPDLFGDIPKPGPCDFDPTFTQCLHLPAATQHTHSIKHSKVITCMASSAMKAGFGAASLMQRHAGRPWEVERSSQKPAQQTDFSQSTLWGLSIRLIWEMLIKNDLIYYFIS